MDYQAALELVQALLGEPGSNVPLDTVTSYRHPRALVQLRLNAQTPRARLAALLQDAT